MIDELFSGLAFDMDGAAASVKALKMAVAGDEAYEDAEGRPYDDLFAFIPDHVATQLASICVRAGVGRCTCRAFGDLYRRSNGHPIFGPKESDVAAEESESDS